MSESNPFGNLKIDVWYKAFIVFGGVITIISLVYAPKFISQKELFLIGIGFFLVGIGEWKNEKYIMKFVTASAFNPFMRITQPIRTNDPLGVLFDILGITAIAIGVLNFFKVITWLN